MKKKERLPTGSKFLPHISRNKLVKMQKEETDPKAQMRLLMCIARKDRKSIRQIAREFNKSYSTTRVWLKRAIELGLKGRYDEQRPGSKPKMDKEQMKSLRKDLIAGPASGGFKSGLWTGKLLKKHISDYAETTYLVTNDPLRQRIYINCYDDFNTHITVIQDFTRSCTILGTSVQHHNKIS